MRSDDGISRLANVKNAMITSTVLSVSLISTDIRGTVPSGRSVITDYFYGTCPSLKRVGETLSGTDGTYSEGVGVARKKKGVW